LEGLHISGREKGKEKKKMEQLEKYVTVRQEIPLSKLPGFQPGCIGP
jgi:hypothetical protein